MTRSGIGSAGGGMKKTVIYIAAFACVAALLSGYVWSRLPSPRYFVYGTAGSGTARLTVYRVDRWTGRRQMRHMDRLDPSRSYRWRPVPAQWYGPRH